MKILSIVTVGGRHIKWLGLYMIFMLSVQSCDMGFILPLNNKFSYDISLSEDSMVKVRSMYFNGWHYLLFDLKGEYVIVLPSNCIMRNNKRVLTDSLRIVLRRPKRK